MLFDAPLGFVTDDPGGVAATAEADGFDGVWTTEAGHDPYLPLAAAAHRTEHVTLGTAIAVAFPRSPMVHAQVAWDLQRLSKGRFILGLGAQVKAHNVRRYGVPGDRPIARMREMIQAIRAVWRCWQDGDPLNFPGEFWSLTLMTPFFNPGAIDWAPPPIYVAAVSEAMLKVAGAEADGIHVHPLHTEGYLDEVLMPVARQAAVAGGRDPDAMALCVPAMIATGRTADDVVEAEAPMRAQIAFYGSTPAYRPVLEQAGKADIAERLHALSRSGGWGEMPALVDDDLLHAVCTSATWDNLPDALARRYAGRATRLMPYALLDDGTPWPAIAAAVKAAIAAPA